tara:strand:+ start:198 stop:836 length:639 start_codon:yes stop_codon:yes gene_type:complete
MDKYNLDFILQEKTFTLGEVLELLDDVKNSKHQVQVNQNIRSFFKVQYEQLFEQIKKGKGEQKVNIPLLLKYASLADIAKPYTVEQLERYYKVHSCVRFYNEAIHYSRSNMKPVGINILRLATDLQKELQINDHDLNICQESLQQARKDLPIASIRDILSRATTYNKKEVSVIQKLITEGKSIANEFDIDLNDIKIDSQSLIDIETNLQNAA